jgi:two-component system OmpR family response regulator
MSHRIAIIEDEQPIRELYRIKLESDGHLVATAKDGLEGLQLIKEHRPHVILLDIMMPHMDGFKLLDEIAKHRVKHGSVIILTNLAYDDAKERAKGYKVDGIYVKVDTTPSQVAEHVREILAKPHSIL